MADLNAPSANQGEVNFKGNNLSQCLVQQLKVAYSERADSLDCFSDIEIALLTPSFQSIATNLMLTLKNDMKAKFRA